MPLRSLSLTALAVAAILTAAQTVDALLVDPGSSVEFLRFTSTYAVWVLVTVSLLAKSLVDRRDRLPWLLLTLGLALWLVANATWPLVTVEGDASPGFTPADLLWLAYYVPTGVGLALVGRSIVRRRSPSAVADALLAGFCVMALSASLVIEPVVAAADGLDTATYLVNLSYPLFDAVLLAIVVGGLALAGWRTDLRFGILAAGAVMFFVADALYLTQSASGTYVSGSGVDAAWAWSGVLVALAAWPRPAERAREADVRVSRRVALMPSVLGAVSLVVIVEEALSNSSAVTIAVAGSALAATLARMAGAALAQRELVLRLRREARTDALTGLGNRRELRQCLTEALEPDAAPVALVVVDLEGLKSYNDAYGEEAGDVLLQRIATSVVLAAGPQAQAFRSGDTEFHLILPETETTERIAAQVARAAEQRGEGFDIVAIWGVVRLPDDAVDPDAALALADRRAQRRRTAGRPGNGARTAQLLRAVLEERSPDTARHAAAVATVAVTVAARLGLGPSDIDLVRDVALLHDIGKLGLPVEVLEKRGALDEEEWRLIRTHTVIGERLLSASPGMERVARGVRSSHERWDGAGYPDRLAGTQIPLASRIVFVCDAFDAITSERPYREPRTPEQALAELHAGAGSQFDPQVVEAFAHVVAESGAVAGTGRSVASCPPPCVS